MSEPRFCDYCGKCLCKIGTDRKNGKGNYKDWSNRPYHKKCFKAISESRSNIYYLHDFNNDDEKLKKDLDDFNKYLEKRKILHENKRKEKNLKKSKK